MSTQDNNECSLYIASADCFPGQYYDAETGHNYNYFRDFDPTIGRYIEGDPIGLAGGINNYAYVMNNPVRNFDIYGLCEMGSKLSQNCLNALHAAGTNSSALTRANDNWDVIQAAASNYGIDPDFLAAIAIRETGFRNIAQIGGGNGRGVFQIDIGKNPSVTESQAYDISYSADFAANMLSENYAELNSEYPDLTSLQLLRATAASYNFGTGNISGNPDTIDVGTTRNNYGINVLEILFYCYKQTQLF